MPQSDRVKLVLATVCSFAVLLLLQAGIAAAATTASSTVSTELTTPITATPTTVPLLSSVLDFKSNQSRATISSLLFSWTPLSVTNVTYCINCTTGGENCVNGIAEYNCTSGFASGQEYTVSLVAKAPGYRDSPPSTATGRTLVSPVPSVRVTGSNESCLDAQWDASNTSNVTYLLTCGSNPAISAGSSLSGSCCGLQSGENHTVSVVVEKAGFNSSAATSSVGQTLLLPVSSTSISWSSTYESVNISWSRVNVTNAVYEVTVGGKTPISVSATSANQTGLDPGTLQNIRIVVKKDGFPDSSPAVLSALTKPQLLASSSTVRTNYTLNSANLANSLLTVDWETSAADGADSLQIDLTSASVTRNSNFTFNTLKAEFRGSFAYSDNATVKIMAIASKGGLTQYSAESYSAMQYTDPSAPSATWSAIEANRLVVRLTATSNSEWLNAVLRNLAGDILQNKTCPRWAPSCELEFPGLSPYTNYSLSYSASYFDRVSPVAPTLHQQTSQAAPSAPQNPRISNWSSNSLTVAWSNPSNPNGEIIAYTVRCFAHGIGSGVNSVPANTSMLSQLVTGLSAGVLYDCDVTAWTTAGEGPASSRTSPQTLLDDVRPLVPVPAAPEFADRRGRGIVATWPSFNFSGGLIFEYIVRVDAVQSGSSGAGNCSFAARIVCADCNRTQNSSALTELNGCASVSSATFNRTHIGTNLRIDTGDILQPYSLYRITVWPVNRAGLGPSNSSRPNRTLEMPSSGVSSPILVPDKRLMRLNFSQPADTRGRIMAYAIRLLNGSGICIQGYRMNLSLACELTRPDACNDTVTVDQLLSDCPVTNSVASDSLLVFAINLSGLMPWSNYSVSVTPVSQTLAGEPAVLTDRTLPDTPSAPRGFNFTEIGDTYAILAWNPPTAAELNGIFRNYWLKVDGGGTSRDWKPLAAYSPGNYRVDSLKQCVMDNTFKMLTQNNYGNSSEASVTGATKIGNLSASVPQGTNIISDTRSRSVKLDWTAVTHGLCTVTYSISRNGSTGWNEVAPTHNATNLLPFTLYSFAVSARVEFNGASAVASIGSLVSVRTDPDQATPPRNFRCESLAGLYNLVRCRWTQPDRFNGVPIRYILRLLDTPSGVDVSTVLPYNAANPDVVVNISNLNYIRPDEDLKFGVRLVNTPGSEIQGLEEQLSSGVRITPGDAYSVKNVDIQEDASVETVGHEKVRINLNIFSKAFNNSYGKIRYCRLLVGRDRFSDADWTLTGDRSYSSSDRGYKRPFAFNVSCGTLPVYSPPASASASASSSRRRLAAPSTVVESTLTIGDAPENCAGECNGPLTYEQSYRVYLVACTSRGCSLSDQSIRFITGFNYGLRQLIGGIVGGVLFALLIVVIVVVFIKRRDQCFSGFKHPENGTTFSNGNRPWWFDDGFRNDAEIPRCVAIADFRRYVGFMLRDSELEVHRQFEEIKEAALAREQSQFTFNSGMADCNRAKNRYTDILPYDHTRVILESSFEGPGHAPDDYVNASYVKGLDREREFIASQGPLPGTVDDHWRMIYQHKVALIITLTQCQEGLKKKSEPYWPEHIGQSENYDEIKVTLDSESSMSSYIVRTMSVTNMADRNQTEPLQVVQLFYTGWADFSVPNLDDLADFLANMRGYAPKSRRGEAEPPILVHCSAGVGRTGTLIALDILVRSLELRKAKTIDVYETVMELRSCRKLMVQTKGQLAFIYRFMLNYLETHGYLDPLNSQTSDPRDIEMSVVYATPRSITAGNSNPAYLADEPL